METLFDSHHRQSDKFMIAGLGNPGDRYHYTRHNIGFRVVDTIARQYAIPLRASESDDCMFGIGMIGGITSVLVKPLSFMNRSGMPILRLAHHFGIHHEALLVVHDEIDLVFGRLKIKQKGGDGGHKGVRSIIDALENDCFTRLRIGIGRPKPGMDVIQYVLSPFDADEANLLDELLALASEAVVSILCVGAKEGMNRFNGKGVLKSS